MNRAFSLVELSIVLVILGLLTGGVLAGQSLIRASELRTVARDINSYRAAMLGFRDKYFYLPGDMLNATSFWGDQATGTASCASAATADGSPGTCNGNGDGMFTAYSEWYRAWQHLALAGMIEGSYPGYGTGCCYPLNGSQPESKVTPAVYSLGYFDYGGSVGNGYGAAAAGANGMQNRVYVGGINSTNVILPNVGFLTTDEAWSIDTKNDDGNPQAGRFTSPPSSTNGTCSYSNATYNLTGSGKLCALTAMVP